MKQRDEGMSLEVICSTIDRETLLGGQMLSIACSFFEAHLTSLVLIYDYEPLLLATLTIIEPTFYSLSTRGLRPTNSSARPTGPGIGSRA
jgi:hypothetical protein